MEPRLYADNLLRDVTHVVAASCAFACVVTPPTYLHIPSFIEIRSGVIEPRRGRGRNLPIPITCLSWCHK